MNLCVFSHDSSPHNQQPKGFQGLARNNFPISISQKSQPECVKREDLAGPSDPSLLGENNVAHVNLTLK